MKTQRHTGSMPDFSMSAYANLLDEIKGAGAKFRLLSGLRGSDEAGVTVFLRHDIDCHPAAATAMAEVEAGHNAKATYYVLLTAHYNPHGASCRNAIRELCSLGHEVGLHYDLRTYPHDPEGAMKHLRSEADRLSEISGVEVKTISCHQPHMGLPDPFISNDVFVHCHDPVLTKNLRYVSDSCRGWRDNTLLEWIDSCALEGARGLQFLTHPELWHSGDIKDRMSYLEQVLTPIALKEVSDYITLEVAELWRRHEGARLHDVRSSVTS